MSKNIKIQWAAPLKNLWLIITAKDYRVPFIINTSNFAEYNTKAKVFYIVESDGDSWFAHDNKFANVIESNASFGSSPQEALMNYMHEYSDQDITPQSLA